MKRKSLIIILFVSLIYFLGDGVLLAQPKKVQPKVTPPENARTDVAEAVRQGKRTDVLLEEYEKLIKENPNDFEAIYGKASCEFLLKRPKSAMYSLHQTIQVEPKFAPAYALMGKILKLTNKMDSAVICYDLASQYETDNNKKVEYKSYVIMKLIKEKKMQEAYTKIKEIYTVAPANKNVAFFHAKMSNIFNQYELAKNSIKFIEPDLQGMDIRESGKYYYELGYALYHLQQFEESKIILQKIHFGPFKRKVDKMTSPYFYHLAVLYAKFHEDATAIMHLDQALLIDKDYSKAHLMKAQLSRRGQDVNETVEHMRNAIKNQPDPLKKILLYDKLAEVELDAGDYAGSLTTLEQALKLKLGKTASSRDRVDPDTWFLLCLAQYKLGNYKESIAHIDEFLGKKIPSPANIIGSFYTLKGLAAKNNNDLRVARDAFKLAVKTPLRDVAEIELGIIKQMKKLEDDEKDDTEDDDDTEKE